MISTFALLLLGSGCTSVVTIHYRQIHNVRVMHEGVNQYNARGKYILCQITRIDNKDTKAIPFYFKLDKVYVSADGEYSPGPVAYPNGATPMTVFQAPPGATVAPGGSTSYDGDFVIDVQSSNQAGQDEHAQFNLLYRSDPGEHVVLAREPALRPDQANLYQPIAPGEAYWTDNLPEWALTEFLACNRSGRDTHSKPCVPQ
ncbi:MAG: hypothetical protein EOO71_03465 [Myxococcaceae bacterium]|nr:MAG: hypothetical protein EOO71_03465 [Myxococcaceae bacterium]